MIAADPRSTEIIKPLAIGDNVRRWRINHDKKWLIVTKIGVDIQRYPAIFAHLSQWEGRLKARQDQGNHWWELRACAYYHIFNSPKIMYPEIAMERRFALDDTGIYPLKTAFSIPTYDLYLLGVLNSSPGWEYLKGISSVLGNAEQRGRLLLSTIFVGRLPIPNASPADRNAIADLVQKCLDARGQGPEVALWEAEIDERVARLYGLESPGVPLLGGYTDTHAAAD